jgi:hypothetical protein
MSAYIFLCGSQTEDECLQRSLFGSKDSERYNRTFRHIRIGDVLFLYNYDEGYFRGPYFAASVPGVQLVPDAWRRQGGFPFQVRVDTSRASEQRVFRHEVLDLIPFGTHPPDQITDAQAAALISRLERKPSSSIEGERSATAYIFTVGKDEMAEAISDGTLRLPVWEWDRAQALQAGDVVFLYVEDDERLYGTWEALAPGRYQASDGSNQSPSRPVLLQCRWFARYEEGLSKAQFEGVIPFVGQKPPRRVSQEKVARLDALLKSANPAATRPGHRPNGQPEYRTDDGHIVKSRGEALIDNWLYRHDIKHVYEPVVSVQGQYIKPDFHLPDLDIYVEYWGLEGDPEYDTRKAQKLTVYRMAGLKLEQITNDDLANLDRRLAYLAPR